MARFDTSGLDDVIREMEQLGELYGETADEMLMAGAEEVKKAWKESAERHKHRDTGDMIESIGYLRQPKRVGDIRAIDIYPQGTDQKGIRNAEKAFILNYGTRTRTASNWVFYADAMCAEPVAKAMEAIWDKKLSTMTIGG